MNHKDIRLGAAGDGNHFLGYRADGDGPTLSGNTGGALIGMNTPALSWYGAHVTVHGDLKVIGHAALEKGLTVSGAVTNLQHGLTLGRWRQPAEWPHRHGRRHPEERPDGRGRRCQF